MARGVSSEEAEKAFESQDPNAEQDWKVAAAFQNAIQCYRDIYKRKRATTQTTLGHFFKRVDRIEPSKEPEPVLSTSNMSDTAACPLPPVADDPSALSSPTISPSSSQQLFLSAHSMPTLYASYCVVVLYFSRYCTVRLNKFSLFLACLYILFV